MRLIVTRGRDCEATGAMHVPALNVARAADSGQLPEDA